MINWPVIHDDPHWCDFHDDFSFLCGGPHTSEDSRVFEPCKGRMEGEAFTSHVWAFGVDGLVDECVLCHVRRSRK
jgi:hypothetical protein